MRWSGPIIAIALVAAVGVSVATAWAVDQKERPFGGPPPQRNTEERPFGGPPPDRRLKPQKTGKTCRTSAGTCELDKARPVGAACSCADGRGAGADGKVE